MPLTRRARAKRPIRLELFLLDPSALLVPAAEVRNQPLEVRTERIGLALSRLLGLDGDGVGVRPTSAGSAGRSEEQQIPDLLRAAAGKAPSGRSRTSGSGR